MSKIIEEFEKKIKFTDQIEITKNKKGSQSIRTKSDTAFPPGIYTLWLEGTEKKEGYGMLYLGISGVKQSDSRTGAKSRWLHHGHKLTGIGPEINKRSTGKKIKLGKGSGDTEHFAEFRKFLVDEGYDLDTVLDKIYICFINLKGVGKEKIAAMETRILETRIAKGQCRCNGAKRMPALTHEELTYFDNL